MDGIRFSAGSTQLFGLRNVRLDDAAAVRAFAPLHRSIKGARARATSCGRIVAF